MNLWKKWETGKISRNILCTNSGAAEAVWNWVRKRNASNSVKSCPIFKIFFSPESLWKSSKSGCAIAHPAHPAPPPLHTRAAVNKFYYHVLAIMSNNWWVSNPKFSLEMCTEGTLCSKLTLTYKIKLHSFSLNHHK